MTITPKLVIRLFNKLKSQEILYNLNFEHDDRIASSGYCVGYHLKNINNNLNNYRLYFRLIRGIGWNLLNNNKDNRIIFDPKEITNIFVNCYWAVTITPEVIKELLRQKKEYHTPKK